MRSIDAGMSAALAAYTRRPAIGLTIEDHIIHLSAYQAPGLSDSWSDCCIASDGSIIRVYLNGTSGSFTASFQYSRISDPSNAGQWSSLTTLSGGSTNMWRDGSCCVSNNSGTLRAFAQQGTGGNALRVWNSTNNGISWTGPVSIVSPPGASLISGLASTGNNEIFYFYDVFGGASMAVSTFSGVWSAPTNWTLPNPLSAQGIAAIYSAGIYKLVYSDGATLYSASYNGAAWTQGPNVASTTSNTIGHISPRLSYFDGLYHLINSEYDNGSISGAIYQFCRVRESFDFVHWSDGWIVPEISSIYGGNYFFLSAPQSGSSGARYYLSTPSTVLSTSAFSQANSNQYLDVSAAVFAYRRSERLNKPAELVVSIDNRDGQYNNLINLTGGTAYQPIGPGASLRLSEGYEVSGSPDTILSGTYRIMKVAMLRSPQQNLIQISGLDLSERLDRKIRWQNLLQNQTLSYLLSEVCARAGLFNPVISAGSQLSQIVPTFVMQANMSYRHALDSLASTYGLDYFLDQNESLQIRELAVSDPSIWSYQQEIEQVAFGQDYQRANHVIANGKPPAGSGSYALTSAEVYDNTANAATRVERLFYHTDFKTTTSAQALIAANLVLYSEQRAQADTRLIVPLNPALQPGDVVTVTDAAAPTGTGQSVVGRLSEHQAIYNAQQAEYASHLSLQGH
ncbi:MAG TPA: hypothetical protein VGD98_23225 [Ktedonobacteraceae bacterium]